MKKLLFYVAIALIAAPSLTSCKKGENDPFLSFKTRKARVVGEWELDAYMLKTVSTGSFPSTSTSTLQNGTVTNNDDGDITTGTVKNATWTFEKDGTWSSQLDIDFTFTEAINGNTVTVVQSHKDFDKGTWNFLGAIDEFKNKERMILNTTESTSSSTTTIDGIEDPSDSFSSSNTYVDGQVSTIFLLDQLKNKEMIVSLDGTTSYTSGNSSRFTTMEGEQVFKQD